MFSEIPDELKTLSQWVVWRYEDRGGDKPTKVPYSPHSRAKASVTDPSTWGGFETACAAYATGNVDGIGFVLSQDDPFAFIDFDDPYELRKDGTAKHPNPEELLNFQHEIFGRIVSYAELSPSGKGLHIIVRGNLPTGRNRSGVEVYSAERFMTMTGNVYRPGPITEQGDTLLSLWAHLGGTQRERVEVESKEETATDNEVLLKAADAVNGEKFKAIWRGEWEGFYKSHSEADQALINMVAFYTQNTAQIERIFLASPLGERIRTGAKKKHRHYIRDMVRLSFDRMPPAADLSGLRIQADQAIANALAKRDEPPLYVAPMRRHDDNPFAECPPGLIGEIAKFIHDAAPRPVHEIALYGAIGLMAGICGRCFNVSGTGLNQYVLLLARTGTGKEAAGAGISALMAELKKMDISGNAQAFIGPSFIASPQAIIKRLSKHPSFVSIIGEFGARLQSMTARNASSADRGVLVALLDLYNKSGKGQVSGSMAYSDAERNIETVQSPAMSLMGESTPETFYAAIDENSISSGLVPRFTVIEYRGDRPDENKWRATASQHPELVNRLFKLCAYAASMNAQGNVAQVKADEGAQSLLDAFSLEADAHIRNAANVHREVWNRAHLKVLKLAALIAVGVNPYDPVISAPLVEWAVRIERYNIARMLEKFEAGQVGANGEQTEQEVAIKRAFRTYLLTEYHALPTSYLRTVGPLLHADRLMPYTLLNDTVRPLACFRNDRFGGTAALKRAMSNMIDAGLIREMRPESQVARYGIAAKLYAWTGASLD